MFIVYQYNCFYPVHRISMTTFFQGKTPLLSPKLLHRERPHSICCMPGETKGRSWPVTVLLLKIAIRPMSPCWYTAGSTEPLSGLFKHPLPNEDLFILLFCFIRVAMPALSLLRQPLGVCRALLCLCTCALEKAGSATANIWGWSEDEGAQVLSSWSSFFPLQMGYYGRKNTIFLL